MHTLWTAWMAMLVISLSGCGYNTFQSKDEQVTASWSEVVNQYQRRADLVPNLVNTVKGEAKFEQDTLTRVIEARARATSIQATPELINDPAAFQKFQQAQGELKGALSRLMAVSENYPSLRANQGFRDLQAQLEGTENRITVARNRFITSVQEYNVAVRSFPANVTARVFGYKPKANFIVENEREIARPPSVNFDTPPVAPNDVQQRAAVDGPDDGAGLDALLGLSRWRTACGPCADRACHRPNWHAQLRTESLFGASNDSV